MLMMVLMAFNYYTPLNSAVNYTNDHRSVKAWPRRIIRMNNKTTQEPGSRIVVHGETSRNLNPRPLNPDSLTHSILTTTPLRGRFSRLCYFSPLPLLRMPLIFA